ncbi:type I-B CRISPR-associated protein Cas5b [Bacillus thuringiensis]|uniref:type I-B CRISPR-associated protein Cas5b n=1 Tax=Bacillus thuringiensis TaxID=1428 RepID=UPI0021D69587|nr:type I-B CRISPR-associated protein Cas5b [Bacillus thuringiensis]MCU7667769.1 type I-B CRISPR-associated protein Cas5b [Bacillus thuringiensis]
MKGIAFELKGDFAFFKKPDVNQENYFTYSHIHKVALTGILGAIIGLDGYSQTKRNNSGEERIFPEFYQKLKDLRISIVPHGDRGYFSRKIQTFTNTTGFANKRSNLIVKEQWLENPHWTIYLLPSDEMEEGLFDTLADYLINKKAEFIPYLGKNDHYASIINPRWVNISEVGEVSYIQSLFPLSEEIEFDNEEDTFDEEDDFFFRENMPTSLQEQTILYNLEPLVYTNMYMENIEFEHMYETEDKVLVFI